MAATQDDILKAIKDLTDVVKKGNSKRGGNGMTGGNGGDTGVSYEGSITNLLAQRQSYKANKAKAAKAQRLANIAANSKNSKGRVAGLQKAAKSATGAANAAKGGIAGAIAGIATQAAQKIADFAVKMKEFEFKEKSIQLEAAKKSLQVQTALYGTAASKSIAVGVNSVVGDLKETVYQSMDTAMELGKQNFTANIELAQIEFDRSTDTQINAMKKKAAAVDAVAGTVGGALMSIPNPISIVAGALISIGNSIFQAETEMEIMKLEYQKEQIAMLSDFKKDMIDQAKSLVEQFQPLIKGIDKLLMDIDNNAHIVGRNFGFYGESLATYRKAAANINLDMADMGKTFEDFKKMQDAYIANSGRNVLMNGEEGKELTSLDKIFNLADGEAAQLMGAMNIFNTSIESGSDMMFEMYKTANKMGVSNQKFAKDLQKNLKLAEKYQFKGGVEGMMKMSLWAQKVRFNMDSLSAALEKMHTGNIEDVIQTSARLNVLGGNAAMLSDPMAMLYNAYADPAQYAKNMKDMVSGFGHFNKNTGETEFNINEQMRMEAIASAMGISKEEFFNMARQEKKAGAIKNVIGNKYGEEQTDLITQHATFNKKTKQWEVNVMGSDGKVHSKDINNLSKEDLESIFPEEPQEQLVEYTKKIFSLLENQRAIENRNKGELALMTQDDHRQQTLAQQARVVQHNDDYRQAYAEEVKQGFLFQTESLDESLKLSEKLLTTTKNGKTLSQQYYEMSLAGMSSIGGQIENFQNSMAAIIDDDMNALLQAMAEFNPAGAHEVSMALSTQYNTEANRDAWEKAIDAAQDADIENGTGQYNNEDFIESGYGYFDHAGNFYLNMSHNNGDGYDNMETMAKYVEKKGFKVDRNTGQVTKANDLIISPKHGIFELDPEDTITASKPGGSLDRAEQRRSGAPDNINLTVNGTLTLSTGKQSIDLLDVLRNDPNALRELAKEIIVEGSRTTFGGKHQWAPNRYTFGN